ncbi:MAG: energy transducer TonB [Sphingomonas sp.]
MSAIRPTNRDRLGAAAITATVVAALGYALIAGLGVAVPREIAAPLAVFTVAPEPPPPPPEPLPPAPVRDTKPSGAAAPANLRSKATPVTAAVPIVPLVTPPPVTIAPKPDSGADSSTGAADVPGPGPGSGGDGNSTGSGNGGNGSGAGGVPPHRIAGRLSKGDLPEALIRPGGGGTVSVLYVVSPQGRVTDCEVTRSSGNPELDDMTCRLIEQRFRFEPSRDSAGRAVESMVEENHTWVIE